MSLLQQSGVQRARPGFQALRRELARDLNLVPNSILSKLGEKQMERKTICAGVMALASLIVAPMAQAQEKYIGEILMTGANFCPRGSAAAEGQLMAISSNTALFSLLGTTYGGDGRTTFALPDLQGAAPIGTGRPAGGDDVYLGERGQVTQGPGVGTLGMQYCVVMQGIFPSRN